MDHDREVPVVMVSESISGLAVVKKYPAAEAYVVEISLTLSGEALAGRKLQAEALITPSGNSPAQNSRLITLSAPGSSYFIQKEESLVIVPQSPRRFSATIEAHFPYRALEYTSADADLTLSLSGSGRTGSTMEIFIPPTPPPDFSRRP